MRCIPKTAARRNLPAALCWLVAGCLSVCAVAGQPQGPRIAKVTVLNNRILTTEQVLSSLNVKEGEAFDQGRLESAVREWNESQVYGTISYRMEPAAEGQIELVLTLTEAIQITGVTFQGNEHFSDRRLSELIKLQPKDRASELSLRAYEERIVSAYRRDGFLVASATAAFSSLTRTERELAFAITEGPRTWTERIEFEGNRGVRAKDLRDVMESPTRGWIAWLRPGWVNEEVFKEDLKRIESLYAERGYLDARVDGHISVSEDMRRATLRVTVREGELYRVKEVSFEGNTIFRSEELLKAIPIARGDPYRRDKLSEAVEAIQALYADQGYWDVAPEKGTLEGEEVLPAKGADVVVQFRITEGEPVFIRRISIRGLTKTKETVVRRDLTFYPGERASASKFEESERALLNTGYFDWTVPEPVRINLEPEPGALRDAIVEVQEGPTGRLLLSAGIGSEAGLIGGIALEEYNFDISNWPSRWSDLWQGNALRGGGQILSISLMGGTKRSSYSITFEDPSVRNTEWALGTALYSRWMLRREFDEARTGLSLSLGKHLSKYMRRTLTVGYETVGIDGVDASSPPVLLDAEGSHSKPFVRVGAAVDRRDSRFMPTEGYYADADMELAAGDVKTAKLEARAGRYWTVHQDGGKNKHVVGVRSRIGLMDAYSGDVPVFERFYAGGITMLRGFAFDGVSPVDEVTGKPIGGNSMLLGSLEYSFPLSDKEQVRLVTFCDAGYVMEDLADVLSGWDELRLSIGLGIRWRVVQYVPMALELSVAAPLLKQPHDDTQLFQFSLGAERRF